MSNIATMISQSRKLIELGLDPSTADMYYLYLGAGQYGDIPRVGFPIEHSGGRDIPAWSLSALLEVMPSEESKWCILMHAQDFYWCTFEKSDGTILKEFCSNNYIDAAYEMVCWLLEQGMIKEGRQDGN